MDSPLLLSLLLLFGHMQINRAVPTDDETWLQAGALMQHCSSRLMLYLCSNVSDYEMERETNGIPAFSRPHPRPKKTS